MIALNVLVRIPVAAREAVVGAAPHLHEAQAALKEPPGNQTVAAEIGSDRLVLILQKKFGAWRVVGTTR